MIKNLYKHQAKKKNENEKKVEFVKKKLKWIIDLLEPFEENWLQFGPFKQKGPSVNWA